jgi:MFS family permease
MVLLSVVKKLSEVIMEKQTKSFGSTYILLIVVNLVTAFGFSMIATIISSYAITMGAGLTLAGIMAGIFSLSALCIRPISGIAIDRLNKWSMCIFSTTLICLSFIGYSIAPSVGAMLFVRILHGIAFGINGTVSMVLVSECVPKDRLGEGLGYFGVGQIIAQICGPTLGIAIKDEFGYQFLFILISLLTVVAIGLLLWARSRIQIVKIKKPREIKLNLKINNLIAKECIIYALISGLFSLGNGITSSFLVLIGEERGITNIGWFFTTNAIILLLLRVIIGKMVDKSGFVLIVNISLIITAISMFMIGRSSGLMVILLAAVLKAIGQGGGQLSLQSACIKKVDVARVGIASSTYYIGADIGQGFGPIIGGKISDIFNYEIMFYSIVVLMLIGLIVFNLYQWRYETRREITN